MEANGHMIKLFPSSCKFLLQFVVLIISFGSIYGQINSDLKFEHFGSEQGFQPSGGGGILKDDFGYIWVNSSSGIQRFNGYKFQNLKDNTPGHPIGLFKGKNGALWVGMHQSVMYYDPATESFTEFPLYAESTNWDIVRLVSEGDNGLAWIIATSGIYKLERAGGRPQLFSNYSDLVNNQNKGTRLEYVDRRGNLWFVLGDSNLYKLDIQKELFTHYTLQPNDKPGYDGFQIQRIYENRQGTIWAGTSDELYRLVPGSSQFIPYLSYSKNDDDFKIQNINLIEEDAQGNLWLGTSNRLIRLNSQTKNYEHFLLENNIQRNQREVTIHGIQFDDRDNIWIRSYNGLFYLDTKTKDVLHYEYQPSDPFSLQSNRLSGLLLDKEGNLWIRFYQGGLDRLSHMTTAFKHIRNIPSSKNYLRKDYVNAIYEEKNGTIWLGSEQGALDWYDPQTGKIMPFPCQPEEKNCLQDQRISAISGDKKGNIWIGTVNNGLYQYHLQNQTITNYRSDARDPQSISSNGITSLFFDSKERLWIASNGLNRLDPNATKFLHFNHDSNDPFSLSANITTKVTEDQYGDIWIGTAGGGLNRLDPEASKPRFIRYQNILDDSTTISSRGVWDIHEDQNGNLWFGTWRGGLNLFDREKESFSHFTKEDGLASNLIQMILEDDYGNLWISTDNGISRFDPKTQAFTNYDIYDGLQSNHFLYLSAWKSKLTGQLYFGGSNGLTVFHPDNVRKDDFIPPVHIHSMHYYRKGDPEGYAMPVKGIARKNSIVLSYQENTLAFEFVALSYSKTSKNQYTYKLEGAHDSWIQLGNKREITFTNLAPGSYTLLVKGSNGDGVWNETPAKLQITITPPWWQTIWAYLIYGLLATSSIWIFMQWRTRDLRKRQKLLEETVSERTAEVVAEKQRSEDLLLNILPEEVARELKETGKAPPVFFEEVSILFSDLKGFTNISASIPGKQLVRELDDIFKGYDDIMDSVGLEKIQTIGDGYLAACGLPKVDPDHANKCVLAGQQIIKYLQERNKTNSIKWQVRVGIHSGPVTAGVIGKKKYSYDIFGDTVNIAARIESSSVAGRINISSYTHHLVKGKFPCTYRGKINAKGKGELDMYFVDESIDKI